MTHMFPQRFPFGPLFESVRQIRKSFCAKVCGNICLQDRKRAGKKYKVGVLSFGANLDIAQVRISPDLEIGWYMKYTKEEGEVELLPIRPFATAMGGPNSQ
jgi:hypothetical protein